MHTCLPILQSDGLISLMPNEWMYICDVRTVLKIRKFLQQVMLKNCGIAWPNFVFGNKDHTHFGETAARLNEYVTSLIQIGTPKVWFSMSPHCSKNFNDVLKRVCLSFNQVWYSNSCVVSHDNESEKKPMSKEILIYTVYEELPTASISVEYQSMNLQLYKSESTILHICGHSFPSHKQEDGVQVPEVSTEYLVHSNAQPCECFVEEFLNYLAVFGSNFLPALNMTAIGKSSRLNLTACDCEFSGQCVCDNHFCLETEAELTLSYGSTCLNHIENECQEHGIEIKVEEESSDCDFQDMSCESFFQHHSAPTNEENEPQGIPEVTSLPQVQLQPCSSKIVIEEHGNDLLNGGNESDHLKCPICSQTYEGDFPVTLQYWLSHLKKDHFSQDKGVMNNAQLLECPLCDQTYKGGFNAVHFLYCHVQRHHYHKMG